MHSRTRSRRRETLGLAHLRMDAREETLGLLNKIWTKLQALPNASPLELGAFFILLTFILVVVLMMVLTCVTCCCRSTGTKGPQI